MCVIQNLEDFTQALKVFIKSLQGQTYTEGTTPNRHRGDKTNAKQTHRGRRQMDTEGTKKTPKGHTKEGTTPNGHKGDDANV